jgi:O-antigen/teichoic acid export membrane protein
LHLFLFLPFILKCIDPASYGAFSFYEAIVLILSQVILLGAHQVNSDNFKNNHISSLLLGSSKFILINSIILLSISLVFFLAGKDFTTIAFSVLGAFLFALHLNHLNLLKLSGLAKDVLIFEAVLSLIRYIIPLYLVFKLINKDEMVFIWGFLISLVAFNLLSYFKLMYRNTGYGERIPYKQYYQTGKFILIYSISAYLISFSDRVMIEWFVGSEELAVYTLGYKIASIVQVIFLSYLSALLPRIYSSKLSIEKIFNKKLISIAILLPILISTVSYFYLELFYNISYQGAFEIVCITSFAFFFFSLSSITYNYLCLKNEHWFVSKVGFFVAVLNVILNYIFIPSFGIKIAAITTLIAYVIMAMCFYSKLKVINS